MLDRVSLSIKDRYGSQRGFLNALKCKLLFNIGLYGKYRVEDFTEITRIVFVCVGNICRSPVAEAATLAFGVESVSYGLDCAEDRMADSRARNFAKINNLALECHRTRNIISYSPRPGDLLVGMEAAHADKLAKLYPNGPSITIAGLWLKKPTIYLHDPYGSNDVYFDLCEKRVVNAAISLSKLVGSKKPMG
jgi:protein-tyrosine phosphatase